MLRVCWNELRKEKTVTPILQGLHKMTHCSRQLNKIYHIMTIAASSRPVCTLYSIIWKWQQYFPCQLRLFSPLSSYARQLLPVQLQFSAYWERFLDFFFFVFVFVFKVVLWIVFPGKTLLKLLCLRLFPRMSARVPTVGAKFYSIYWYLWKTTAISCN